MDNVDIADQSRDSTSEYVAKYLYQKRIPKDFYNTFYSVRIKIAA